MAQRLIYNNTPSTVAMARYVLKRDRVKNVLANASPKGKLRHEASE